MIQNYFLLLNSDWKQQLDPRKLKYLKNFASADTYFDSHMHGGIEGFNLRGCSEITLCQ